ncbi:serine hydrolase [Sandaracinobacteroides saxicola]|uniref:Serine hydrolase n=1 Tax=Sandaracinobacteroides saxicola TaxID=2759707 RepID=A0A7G5IN13_9SPHN|nr:serine hydrolase [Sandaracinobacteroides saxicola]QMW24755.1 serine hydrolase [Sandaracinobacteroides saxicola]
MTGTPGSMTNCVYGNSDYLLLSLILAKKMGVNSFEAALSSLVLNPLGQTRTRGSRSDPDNQVDGEARHHMTVHSVRDPNDPSDKRWELFHFDCGSSVRHTDERLVAKHYGCWDYEFLDGCGGLSAGIVDMARLCALFAARQNNPVLDTDTLTDMLTAARVATDTLTGPDAHGHHGFDWVANAGSNRWTYSKGGWLPGQGTVLTGDTGGYFYCIAQNGNTHTGYKLEWLDPLKAIVENRDWGSTDHFPAYGMAALPQTGSMSAQQFKLSRKLEQRGATRTLEASMARSFRP